MTRLQFRASVSDARPSAAWSMVLIATSTLALTGQIEPWALAAAYTGISFSYFCRKVPRPWQRNPILLNLAAVSISIAALTMGLRGQPATIALAHFAVLTQGLQLLDARPRQSEFLLVALALFQVVLAANLTMSAFFPPMLILFLVSTTWTLMIHTLRSEAIEAGDHSAARSQMRGGLLRATAWASSVSILLAIIIFTMLPRFRSSVINHSAGDGFAVAGFTDEVRLGTIGKIRMDSTVVLRVQTLDGTPPAPRQGYWRGLAFDHFDGERWSVTPVIRSAPGGSPTFEIDLGRALPKQPLVQRIVREPVKGGVIFGAGEALTIRGAVDRIEVDVHGSLYSPDDQNQRVRYTILTEAEHPSDSELRSDSTTLPNRRGEAFLALPDLVPEIRELALRITASAERDADRVRALEDYLRQTGHYTDSPPEMDARLGKSPIEGFLLGELSGHCEYFASGMVVLARSIEIPARLVNGFAGGQQNRLGNFVELTRADAHAWVEIHYEDAGWVRYDPTPPSLRTRADSGRSLTRNLLEVVAMMELWWYQRVVDFDTSDQVQMFRSSLLAWNAFRRPGSEFDAGAPALQPGFRGGERWGSAVLFVAAAGALAAALGVLLRRYRPKAKRDPVPRTYAKALSLLTRRGWPKAQATTARDFVEDLRGRVSPEAAEAFHLVTEAYLAERFGGATANADNDSLRVMRRELPRRIARK